MEEEKIIYTKQNNIGTIRLNNPPLNIFDKSMSNRMDNILTEIEKDKNLRTVILCSGGRSFSAGSNMAEILDYINDGTYVSGKMDHELKNRDRIANLPIPTIAAVDTSAYGGGFEMILSCDMIIAAPDVKFCMATADIGSFPGAGGGPRLARLIGRARAIEHMCFSRKMTAQQGFEWGMVNAIAEKGKTAYDTAIEWAEEMVKKPAISMHCIKELILGMTSQDDQYIFNLHQKISQEVIEAGELEKGIKRFFDERAHKHK